MWEEKNWYLLSTDEEMRRKMGFLAWSQESTKYMHSQ